MSDPVPTLRKLGLTDAEILNGRRHVVYQATLSAPQVILALDKPITDAEIKQHGTETKAKVEAFRKVAKEAGITKMDGAKTAVVLDAVVLAKPVAIDVVEQKDWEPDPIKPVDADPKPIDADPAVDATPKDPTK